MQEISPSNICYFAGNKGRRGSRIQFFYKAFGNSLEEYLELLAMPRELIMFRSYFEENGTTAKWQTLYHKLNDEQKERLMALVSHNVSELRNIPWPDELKDILEKRSILMRNMFNYH